MALNKTAFSKRAEQLKRYEDSETNRESILPKIASERKVRFSSGCIFLAACAAGDKDEVLNMLNSVGADIDTANVDGLTALHQVNIGETFEFVKISALSMIFCLAFFYELRRKKKLKWLFLEFLKQAKRERRRKIHNSIVCRMRRWVKKVLWTRGWIERDPAGILSDKTSPSLLSNTQKTLSLASSYPKPIPARVSTFVWCEEIAKFNEFLLLSSTFIPLRSSPATRVVWPNFSVSR